MHIVGVFVVFYGRKDQTPLRINLHFPDADNSGVRPGNDGSRRNIT